MREGKRRVQAEWKEIVAKKREKVGMEGALERGGGSWDGAPGKGAGLGGAKGPLTLPGGRRRKVGRSEGGSGWQGDGEAKAGGRGQRGLSELTASRGKQVHPGVALAVGSCRGEEMYLTGGRGRDHPPRACCSTKYTPTHTQTHTRHSPILPACTCPVSPLTHLPPSRREAKHIEKGWVGRGAPEDVARYLQVLGVEC